MIPVMRRGSLARFAGRLYPRGSKGTPAGRERACAGLQRGRLGGGIVFVPGNRGMAKFRESRNHAGVSCNSFVQFAVTVVSPTRSF